jgi:hypothetical protein
MASWPEFATHVHPEDLEDRLGDLRRRRLSPPFPAPAPPTWLVSGRGHGNASAGRAIRMTNAPKLSRRLFAAAIAGSATTLPQQPAASPAPPAPGVAQVPTTPRGRTQPVEPLPFAKTLVFTRKDAELPITPYPMSQVRLLAGPCKQAADYHRAYMMRRDVFLISSSRIAQRVH